MESSNKLIPMEIVKDPERIRIMLDETRLSILKVMRSGIIREGETNLSYEFTVAEIAARLETSPQRLYHHIDKLLAHNFIFKSKEVKKSRSVITYYQRKAKGFVVSYSSEDKPIEQISEYNREFIVGIIKAFNLDISEESKEKLFKLINELISMESMIFDKLSDKIEIKGDIDRNFFHFMKFLQLIIMLDTDKGRKIYKEFSDIFLPVLDL